LGATRTCALDTADAWGIGHSWIPALFKDTWASILGKFPKFRFKKGLSSKK